MSQPTADVTILMPEGLNSHAAGRLEREFKLVRVPRGDAALVTPEMAASVRGIASSTPVSTSTKTG